MAEFLERQRTLENYWRAVILFGQNVASYKFALAKSLIELSNERQDLVKLEDLAEPFSRHIIEHLAEPQNKPPPRLAVFSIPVGSSLLERSPKTS
jgi:hypothetical protein